MGSMLRVLTVSAVPIVSFVPCDSGALQYFANFNDGADSHMLLLYAGSKSSIGVDNRPTT
jgi:hypothetical protein